MSMDAIDIFCHRATRDYSETVHNTTSRPLHMLERALAIPVMTNINERQRLMDRFPGYRQIPCLGETHISHALDTVNNPAISPVEHDSVLHRNWKRIAGQETHN